MAERSNGASKFKLDLLKQIPDGEPISYLKNGDFLDLCAGPHVMRTGNIEAFKLTSVAAAYYKGHEKGPQLQRIYGTAFNSLVPRFVSVHGFSVTFTLLVWKGINVYGLANGVRYYGEGEASRRLERLRCRPNFRVTR